MLGLVGTGTFALWPLHGQSVIRRGAGDLVRPRTRPLQEGHEASASRALSRLPGSSMGHPSRGGDGHRMSREVHPRSTPMTVPRRLLVIANETIEGAALHDAIRSRARDGAIEVVVVGPALNSRLRHWMSDTDAARRAAEARLVACLERIADRGF